MATEAMATPSGINSTTATYNSSNNNKTLDVLSSYQNRHSSIAASIFFNEWNGHNTLNYDDNNNLLASTLPNRLIKLVQHYKHNSHLAKSEARSVTLSLDPMEARRIDLTACLVVNAPRNFFQCFKILFKQIFQFYLSNSTSNDDSDMEEDIEGERQWSDAFDFNEEEFYDCIEMLQWLNPNNTSQTDILTHPFIQSIQEIVSDHTTSQIKGRYEEDDQYSILQSWVKHNLLPLVIKLTKSSNNTEQIDKYEIQINHLLSDCYCATRQDEIFDIVTDYPDSLPAIIDLNRVLQKTHALNAFIGTLKDTFRERLLHPGAQTIQILQIYIYTIKVLRIIDPTDCLLEHVSYDIKAYLRQRGDTVRCIINALTDEDALSGDLYKELQRQDNVKPLEETQYDSDDEEEMPGWDWNPSPSLYYQRTSGNINLGDKIISGSSMRSESVDSVTEKELDLLSMLVGIYGSNDLFVDEYRLMLADKLLANIDFDTDREVHNLELLKLRFGETSMRQCEIMIKDIGDSKRIAANIHSSITEKNMEEDDNPLVDAAIVSHIFWPPLQKESMKNHPRIQTFIDQFSLEYAKYKNPRRLVWFDQLGQVELELDVFDNGEIVSKSFTCAPIQATLISHFEDNDGCWTSADLANETGVAEDVIKKKMGYWINNHVVKVSRGADGEAIYNLCSHSDAINALQREQMYEEEDNGLVVSMSGQETEELSTYESYVLNMLSNLGQLPLERIHNMLKMFVTGSDHNYNMTPQQLSQFLQQICKKEKIEYGADGMYKLVKK